MSSLPTGKEPRGPSGRRRLFGCLAVVASLVLACVCLEVGLRLVRPTLSYSAMPQRIVVHHFASSADLPFELKRSFSGQFAMLEFDTRVTTNAAGFRGPELEPDKRKILCLGDSFTFGFGVEDAEAFPAVLQTLVGEEVQVVNGGFAAACSPDGQLRPVAAKEPAPALGPRDRRPVPERPARRRDQPLGVGDGRAGPN